MVLGLGRLGFREASRKGKANSGSGQSSAEGTLPRGTVKDLAGAVLTEALGAACTDGITALGSRNSCLAVEVVSP